MNDIVSKIQAAELYGAPFTPSDWVPSTEITLTFPTGPVSYGSQIRPDDAASTPIVSFAPPSSDKPGTKYCLVSVDPDAPNRSDPIYSPIRHWIQDGLVVREDGTVTTDVEPLMPYAGPRPPPKMGLHRYTFLLYRNTVASGVKPLADQKTFEGNELMQRLKWDFSAFAEENGLELIALNWFLAQNDEQ
ncbi:PEBP-like protein [Meredithblackwellia eburnea MCA 4105]